MYSNYHHWDLGLTPQCCGQTPSTSAEILSQPNYSPDPLKNKAFEDSLRMQETTFQVVPPEGFLELIPALNVTDANTAFKEEGATGGNSPILGETIPNEVLQNDIMNQSYKPYVVITEQPAPRCLRFRYLSEITEGRSAGRLVGVHNTAEVRTYPTIKVMNYYGPYVVVVSCVTKDGPPYRLHPHNLIGREDCKKGVCKLVVNNPDMTCSFTNLGIQFQKKKDIGISLKVREKHKLDKFKTGFNHTGSIDLNVLRLSFEVFIQGPNNSLIPLPPIVSDPIYNKKAMSELKIVKLSHTTAPAIGGTEVILLCDRVAKEDIQIWFFDVQGSRIVWESQGEFQPSDVYKQVAISFRTPSYHNENIQRPVPVFIELRKPSENKRGEPRPFCFLPIERDPQILFGIPRRKQKFPQWIKAEPVDGLSDNDEPFSQPSTSFSEHSCSTILPTVPVSIGDPSASPHFTSAYSLAPATSPEVHCQASATPPFTGIHSPIKHQMRQQSETLESNNLNEIRDAEEDSLIERFDSLDLNIPVLNKNITSNLSASLFDSAPSITDTTYKDTSSSTDQ